VPASMGTSRKLNWCCSCATSCHLTAPCTSRHTHIVRGCAQSSGAAAQATALVTPGRYPARGQWSLG
ncbi:unnamed protein product, partial [Clonostachys rosea]